MSFAYRLMRTAQAVKTGVQHASADLRLLLRRRNGTSLRYGYVNGMPMLVPADDDIGFQIYFFGEYERQDAEFLAAQVREADVCFDIGANVGFYTLMLASTARKGHVHAFEPVPLSYHLLSTNVLVNDLSNVTVNQYAASDRNGIADFKVCRDSAYSSLLDTGRKPAANKIAVSTVTLDSYCEQNGITSVDVLKLDVEGAEGQVLTGAQRLLSDDTRRPRLMMIELYDPMLNVFGSSIVCVVQLLRGYGYRPFLSLGGKLIDFEPQHHNRYYNVLFARSRVL